MYLHLHSALQHCNSARYWNPSSCQVVDSKWSSEMAPLIGIRSAAVCRWSPFSAHYCSLFMWMITPELVSSTAKLFADKTKVYSHIPDLESCSHLQDDLNKFSAWSSKWLLNFNAHKCVVLKIKESFNYLYTLDGVPLKSVSCQKDMGITISNYLKPRNHIMSSVSKANQRVGLIKRCFTHLKFDLIDRLFKAIVRPILEYGSPTWSPTLLCDINGLERVQKNCYHVATDLTDVCGPGWEPPTLISNWEFADLYEVYKCTHGMYKTEASELFNFNPAATRGPSLNRSALECVYLQRVTSGLECAPSALNVKLVVSICAGRSTLECGCNCLNEEEDHWECAGSALICICKVHWSASRVHSLTYLECVGVHCSALGVCSLAYLKCVAVRRECVH